jgi:hypothetical protein
MAYIGKQPTVGNFVKLDAITTSATTTFNLTNGGVAYSPQSANHCIVSLNGVIQSPNTSFTISGSTIVFASTLSASDVIDFILVLGDVLNIGTPSDATVGFSKITSNLITGATAETSIAGGDSILIYDDSASALRKMTRTNFVSGIGGVNTPLVQANLASGDQSISATTYTKLAFDTETIDTGSIYNNSTYTATIATTGKYFVSTYCRISALNGTSDFGILQITNSARTIEYATTLQSGNTGYGFASLACSALISLSASDTLSVYVYATEAVSISDDNAGFTIFKMIE